jgi:hypothetical protein
MKTIRLRSALLAAALGLAMPAVGAAKDDSIWTGYMASGKTFTRASLEWRQPAVTCTVANAQVSIWVGFGGAGTLQQDGAIAVCDRLGAPKFYKMFWEMLRAPPPNQGGEPILVSPGDDIVASVDYDHKHDQVTLEVKDKTSGQDLKTVQPCNGACPLTSVDWIVEAPGGGKYPLADFGSLKLTHAEAGAADAGLDYSGFTMVRKGVTMATCDDLRSDDDGHGKSFTCTFRAAQ